MTEKRNIELRLLEPNNGQIEGLPKNPRQIKGDKFKKLVQSIKEDPEMMELREILVYPHNGKYVIIGGNMRYEALKELNLADAPCKVIDPKTPVEKLRAYTIKDNSGFGEWDWEMLANEWEEEELDKWAVDLPEKIEEDIEGNVEVQEDDFDEETDAVESVCKVGDIWQLGQHRLICGDSTNEKDVDALMNGEQADLWLTDPPYNVAIKNKQGMTIENDNMDSNDFAQFLTKAFKATTGVMSKGCPFYV